MVSGLVVTAHDAHGFVEMLFLQLSRSYLLVLRGDHPLRALSLLSLLRELPRVLNIFS